MICGDSGDDAGNAHGDEGDDANMLLSFTLIYHQ